MSIFPIPDKTKADLKAEIKEHKRIERVFATRERKGLPTPEMHVTLRAENLAALADKQFKHDNFEALQEPKPMRENWLLVMNLWEKVNVWACTRCGAGIISKKDGTFDGRDLHDPICPAKTP